jgi:hypothetical protein
VSISDRGQYIDIEKLTSNLVLYPTTDGIEEAKDQIAAWRGTVHALGVMLEDHMGQSWNWVPPEDIGAMTDAPIISDEGFINDDGRWEPLDADSRVWAHMDYMVENPIERWAKGLPVYFHASPMSASSKSPKPPKPPKSRTEYERLRDFFFPKRPGSHLMSLKSWRR